MIQNLEVISFLKLLPFSVIIFIFFVIRCSYYVRVLLERKSFNFQFYLITSCAITFCTKFAESAKQAQRRAQKFLSINGLICSIGHDDDRCRALKHKDSLKIIELFLSFFISENSFNICFFWINLA